ncbi:MAG: abortive infection system antitoxin AbiGi family protein, partial [Mariprofundaceae bacterium]|nr:abortive infection system antitoxin AbiGi family protein [Mariprofundaceae bacterium]
MICFTDLRSNNTSDHQSDFGSFGVAVSKQWARSHGAKKVTYIELDSDKFNSYFDIIKRYAPDEFNGVSVQTLLDNPETRFSAEMALTSKNWAQRAGIHPEYIKMLSALEWTQTSEHVAQSEWRIRNPRPYTFTSEATRKERIDLLVNCLSSNLQDEVEGLVNYTIDGTVSLACTGKHSLVLPLPVDQIQALFCPKKYEQQIWSALFTNSLQHIRLITS